VDESQRATLGKCRTLRQGKDVTVVSWSRQVHACVEACEQLAAAGIEAELIDLCSIWPWDREAVLGSCGRTGRLLVVHEAVQAAGFGAEVAATAAEATGCKVRRLGAPRIPVGYAPVLEAEARVSAGHIANAVRALC
jgi:pyruvate dehydrogenase E1 component beta subunit